MGTGGRGEYGLELALGGGEGFYEILLVGLEEVGHLYY